MTGSTGRRFVRVMAVVILLGAVLPNAAYLGHWAIPGLDGVTAAPNGESHSHAGHCHGTSACADQAGYGLQWWSETQDTLILDGGPQREHVPEQPPSPTEPAIPRLDPPPRYA